MKKRIILVTIIGLCLLLLPLIAQADTSGTCGENATWVLDDDRVLTISGSGAISGSPWDSYAVDEIVIRDGITSIGRWAFSRCHHLRSTTVPKSVKSIEDYAFSFFSSNHVVFYFGTEEQWNAITIGEQGSGAKNLNRVRYLTSSGSCGDNASWVLDGDRTLTISGSGPIDNNIFLHNSAVRRLVIKNGITSIGPGAFYGCENLVSASIPDSVETIGASAFYQCISLKSVDLGNGVTTIGSDAFIENNIKSITIPDSVTSIGSSAFHGCRDLTSVSIGNGVTNIPWATFDGCNSLVSLTLGNNVRSIGSCAFSCCDLRSITFGNSIEMIGQRSFDNNRFLTDIVLPGSIKSIDYYAFDCCNNIKNVYYDGSEADWGKVSGAGKAELMNALIFDCHDWTETDYRWSDDYSSLTATRGCHFHTDYNESETVSAHQMIVSPTENKTGSVFWTSDDFENPGFAVQEVLVDSIPALKDMKVLRLPASTETVESEAFSNISAEAVIIPDGCTAIESKAFLNCVRLLYVRIPAEIKIPVDAFSGCPDIIIDQQ